MDKKTYEALKTVIKNAREYGAILNNKKRKNQEAIFKQAVLYRDIVQVENWMQEVEKEFI